MISDSTPVSATIRAGRGQQVVTLFSQDQANIIIAISTITNSRLGRSRGALVAGAQPVHRVTPGITGWAQVNGCRGEIDTLEKARARVEHDLYYIENWSLWLDTKILVLTVPILLSGDNAY